MNIQQNVKYFIQYHHSTTKYMFQLTVSFIYDNAIQSRERDRSLRLVFFNHSNTACRWREYDCWNVTGCQFRQDNFLFLLRNFIASNVRHVCIIQCLCMDDMQMAFCHVLCLTFRHRSSCTLGQVFHYSPENPFYIFNQQIYFIIWYLLDRASLI